eukprot:CAMPEP_0113855898 /NCGR_PEP_ID=MMETSP0372-20130328/8692_1 /TAXON_ID=340204 /ORGANISM="Lankesteria abbotti" /LENGTH=105 /DNA_ID=CAMNT_0000830351 /DNA_START=1 /DNA_END=316 /DNA_ORIENTATION=+ /assembly_acc=CAM_ASM_000359
MFTLSSSSLLLLDSTIIFRLVFRFVKDFDVKDFDVFDFDVDFVADFDNIDFDVGFVNVGVEDTPAVFCGGRRPNCASSSSAAQDFFSQHHLCPQAREIELPFWLQ